MVLTPLETIILSDAEKKELEETENYIDTKLKDQGRERKEHRLYGTFIPFKASDLTRILLQEKYEKAGWKLDYIPPKYKQSGGFSFELLHATSAYLPVTPSPPLEPAGQAKEYTRDPPSTEHLDKSAV
ncbi:MAG TPA: hypothetical protein VJK51_03005 [Candidatus Nanoarchaeia archaeon]|nr:hypothetical protein [Candidatus Nanoarchaeia archaeon]